MSSVGGMLYWRRDDMRGELRRVIHRDLTELGLRGGGRARHSGGDLTMCWWSSAVTAEQGSALVYFFVASGLLDTRKWSKQQRGIRTALDAASLANVTLRITAVSHINFPIDSTP